MRPTIDQQIAHFGALLEAMHSNCHKCKAVRETLEAVKEWREAGDSCDGARLMKATAALIACAPLQAEASDE